jgi:integrase
MFKGSTYCRRWTYEGKKRKAWGIRWSVNGGPVERKIVADTKDGAKAELDKKREDYQRRLLGVAEGKTLKDLAPVFLQTKENQGRSMRPIRMRVESILLPALGARALESIDAEAIDEYIKARKAAGVQNATINRELAVLRHMLRLAVRKWKWLRQEPYIEMLPEGGPRDVELTEEEEAKLAKVTPLYFWRLIQAGLWTGMRSGELCGLTWGQIDVENRVIDFEPTKRGRKRLMPIAEPLYYVLVRMRDERRNAGGIQPEDRVFLRADGKPFGPYAVPTRMRRALKLAGITRNIRFHDLRHTVASRLKRRGVDDLVIQQTLGHKEFKTTRGYINIDTEQIAAGFGRLAASTNLTQEISPVP